MGYEKILIIDDDYRSQSELVEKFKSAGFDVLTAKDGESGIASLNESPDIIITELLLPKVSGIEVLRRVRIKSNDTPLIVLSTIYRDEAFFDDLKNRYGISGYFIKPVQFEKVYSLIKEIKKIQPQREEKKESTWSKKFSGEIVPLIFPILLHKFYMNKTEGRLRLQTGNIIKEFYFKNGLPVFAKSNLIQETLGRVLLDTGLISKMDYELSIRKMSKERKRHGEILLEMGVLPINLKEALRMQLKQKLINTCGWKSGTYYFVPEKGLKFDIESEITPAEVVPESIRTQIDEETCDTYLNEFLQSYVYKGKPNYSLQELRLTKKEERFFLSIDGSKTMLDLIEKSGMDPKLTKKLLISFLILGLIEVKSNKSTAIESITDTKEPSEDDKLLTNLKTYLETLKNKNYFQVLGLTEDPKDDEVKKSYFLLAREYHPDRFFNKSSAIKDTAEEIFTILTNAFNTLMTAESRKKYLESIKGKTDEKKDDVQSLVNAEIQFQKGMIYYKSQDYTNAEECFKWAVKLNPKEAEYNGWLAWVQYKKNPKDAGIHKKTGKAIEHALQMNAKWDQGYIFLAYLARVENNEDKVEEYFRKALECNPNNQDALREIRVIEMRKSKSESLFKKLFKK